MLISEIIPYERNARHNERAIPAVADSIREFGLRGTIGLESRERPVIVFGHTRVAACKSLGWDEIPDGKIEFCDDLTEDQIKAFRIADNKTGDIATYNKAMLREEVRGIKEIDMSRFGCDFKSKLLPYGAFRIADNKTGDIATYNKAMLREEVRGIKEIDMSRFGCDFKSKLLPYGAERLKTDRAYNLDLVNRLSCGEGGFPTLDAVDARPSELQGFNYAKSTPDEQKAGKACHFFIDDYQFERLWTSPAKYLDALRGYDCVLTPDFSLYMDMPAPMQACHFFIDDYQFERLWTSPAKYLDALRGYDCVLTPDFSLYMDMPAPMQAWNRYRSQALGRYWQDNGIAVVPTLSWAQPDSYAFCFEGVPRHSTVATSTVGVKGDADALAVWMDGMREAMRRIEPSRVLLYGGDVGPRHSTVATSTVGVKGDADALAVWMDGMREAMRRIEPSRVLLYGGDVGFDFGGCEIVNYKNSVTERMSHGR